MICEPLWPAWGATATIAVAPSKLAETVAHSRGSIGAAVSATMSLPSRSATRPVGVSSRAAPPKATSTCVAFSQK